MKVAGYNLGCKVNKYELDSVLQSFEEHGDEIIDFDDFADVYLISTCSVTSVAEKKSRKYINRTKKINPNAITVAFGCYIQNVMNNEIKNESSLDVSKILDANLLKSVDIFVGTKNKSKIRELVLEKINSDEKLKRVVDLNDVTKFSDFETMKLEKRLDNERAYLKIQDGCNNFCSYCIITYVRGRERSRDLQSILEEAKKLADDGAKEIVLTGIEVASYGKDLANNLTLLDVIDEVSKIDGIERIRLSSLEQSIITDKFIDLCLKNKKLCHHFHLSLQSGSDSVLKRMNRKYTTAQYYEKVLMLKKALDDVAITTDLIVGFPEETEDEAKESLEFARKVGFSDIHVFPYSNREGTRASNMKQVSDLTKMIREKKFLDLKRQLVQNFVESFLGKQLEVLVEQSTLQNGGETFLNVGHTSNFIKVKFKSNSDLSNSIISVTIKEIRNLEVFGEI